MVYKLSGSPISCTCTNINMGNPLIFTWKYVHFVRFGIRATSVEIVLSVFLCKHKGQGYSNKFSCIYGKFPSYRVIGLVQKWVHFIIYDCTGQKYQKGLQISFSA